MIAKIKRWRIIIKGTTPVIFNRMKKELIDEFKKVKKNEMEEWEEKNWRRKAEFDEKNNIILPILWLKSMLINSCMRTRLNPHFAISKKETYTQYMQNVQIQPNPKIILCKMKELTKLSAFYPAQGAKGGGKVWRCFPKFDAWSAEFQLIDPFGRMKKEELQELLEYGGMFIGIGDQRPMGFGRFEISSIDEIERMERKP